jgi:hypothetical protein
VIDHHSVFSLNALCFMATDFDSFGLGNVNFDYSVA